MKIRLLIPMWLAILVGPSFVTAQSFDGAREEMDRKLEKSLSELSDLHNRISKEKIPLSEAVARLEKEVVSLRRERDRLLEGRDSRTIDLTSLRKEVESLDGHEGFVHSRLNEFVRDLEGRLDISELARYEELTSAARLADKNAGLDADGKREAKLAVVDAALDRLRAQIGGHVYPGEALSPQGILTRGRFIAFGPTVFYASDDGSVAGIVENQINAADPVVVELPGGLGAELPAVAAENKGLLPLDATLGKALKREKARKSLGQYIREGGMIGYVIIVLGAAALVLTLFKASEILRFRTTTVEQMDRILEALANGHREAAMQDARRIEGVAGELLATGVEHSDEKRGVLEELLFEKILGVRPMLERFLPFLAVTAGVAPLLGLLGTVTGMIKTFQLITIFGTGDAKSLSSGISEALVTTALGLIVAIPVLVLHGMLSRMAKQRLGALEQLSVAFVNGVMGIRQSAR
jgi:biopolymer transport protein ExbB